MFCRKSKLLGLEALAHESPSPVRPVEDEYTQESVFTHNPNLYNNRLSGTKIRQKIVHLYSFSCRTSVLSKVIFPIQSQAEWHIGWMPNAQFVLVEVLL
jgi:hypothetical protein